METWYTVDACSLDECRNETIEFTHSCTTQRQALKRMREAINATRVLENPATNEWKPVKISRVNIYKDVYDKDGEHTGQWLKQYNDKGQLEKDWGRMC